MSWFKSGAVILFLASPFALYVAWQLYAGSRLDLIAKDPPQEKEGPSKDQLAKSKEKADAWDNDIKKMEAVAFQFRQPVATDAVSDSDCKTAVTVLAARSADLTNLDKFLSNAPDPNFVPTKLSQKYTEWQESKKKLVEAAKDVETWLANPLTGVTDPDSADGAVAQFQRYLNAYNVDPRFSDPTQSAEWTVQCRIKVMRRLDEIANEPYQKVKAMQLPLQRDNSDVKKALEAPRAIAKQFESLKSDLDKVKTASLKLSDKTSADAAAMTDLAGRWSSRAQYLNLFAEPTLFTKNDGATVWLVKVRELYGKTNPAEDRAWIRGKVQEFCEAFIPVKVLLDDQILWKRKELPRKSVAVLASDPNKGGEIVTQPPLTADPDGLNEFNVEKKYAGDGTAAVQCNKEPGVWGDLKPTTLSEAAMDYLKARTSLLSGIGVSKWSVNSIEELKNKCMPIAEAVNRLKVPVGKSETGKSDVPHIWDRLQNLSDGAKACPDLFTTKD